MFCKKCGNEISNPNAKFCTKCGNKLSADVPNDDKSVVNTEIEQANDKIHATESVQDENKLHVHNNSGNIKIHKMVEVVSEGINEKTEPEEPEIPKKEYSPLEQALNNIQNRQKKCPHCGMMVLNEARFCFNCGKKI